MMAYPYQNNYPYPMPDRLAQLQYPQMMQPPQQNSGLLWVSGEIGAKSYLVAPGTTVLLMDSEAQRFYLKSTDISGMPNIRTFEYSEVRTEAQKPPLNVAENLSEQFVTREEYNEMRAQYEAILTKLNELTTEKPTKRKAVENE
jgi:hypothetical protein